MAKKTATTSKTITIHTVFMFNARKYRNYWAYVGHQIPAQDGSQKVSNIDVENPPFVDYLPGETMGFPHLRSLLVIYIYIHYVLYINIYILGRCVYIIVSN